MQRCVAQLPLRNHICLMKKLKEDNYLHFFSTIFKNNVYFCTVKLGGQCFNSLIAMKKPSRSRIHWWAAIGGATAAALPVGADATALAAEEVLMTIRVAAMFGEKISKSAAEGLIASSIGSVAGTAIFESLNLGYPATIPAKTLIAIGVIESLGNAIYEIYDNKYNG